MAELSPEQIAKGYYTDISGIGTALDKAQEQEALRAKAKQAQQDKLYQGIKDVTSVLDNKFTATGTAADPILLSQINKMKGDLTQGIVSGKISPTAAYMTAGSKVADINNLAGTISQYRQNVEKKIAELKKDRPELNSELLMNDVIKAGLFDPQTGEIVTPNSNYDYVSTILDKDRTGRYSDKDLIHKISAEEFIKTPGRSFTLNLGNGIESEATVRPGQKVVRGKQGGLDIDYDKLRVGESIQETTVMKNGKPVKKTVNVGLFDAAPDDLINYFEGNRLAKRGALIEMGEMDEYADSNPEYGKKWNSLNDQEKYRVAVLNYAVKHFGTAGSKVEKPSLSAETQLSNMRRSGSGGGKKDYVNPVEAMINDYVESKGNISQERLLSHFPGEGIFMGYASKYDPQTGQILTIDNEEGGKGVKVYGYPEKVGDKLIIKPFQRYLSEGLRWDANTPIGAGKGYDLLNRNKYSSEAEQMMNIYSRLNSSQPSIYTK
jgi:hypothetical protein